MQNRILQKRIFLFGKGGHCYPELLGANWEGRQFVSSCPNWPHKWALEMQLLAASPPERPSAVRQQNPFLMFNRFVLTWCSWCVPSHELWPWPTMALILLQVTETGCLWLKVSCMSWISLSLPKTTCVFCKACSCNWINKPVLWICRNACLPPLPPHFYILSEP